MGEATKQCHYRHVNPNHHRLEQKEVAMARLTGRTRIGSGGCIVIPQEMQEALGVREGDHLLLEVDEQGLRVCSVRSTVLRAQQVVARYVKPGRSLAAELTEERRRGAERE
jgi:bifunctional DNA-binding transcriptional regulator/antitoxin component of YhaV-PrlF toxin-antitoxin module